jgi:hypothetical protein
MEMIRLLDIPLSLTSHSKALLIFTWPIQCTKHSLILSLQCFWMTGDGTWTLRKPRSDELIEIFVSKGVWHSKYQKLFLAAKDHGLLLKWLENGQNPPSNITVFGDEKNSYSFKDLKKS